MDGVREVGGTLFRWAFGAVEFNEAAWELRVGGMAVDIERRPLDVLGCLLRHAGEVVTKDELLDAAWSGRIVVEGALTNAIGKLR
ncbi:MAG: winged helix-turn-helix domain-containing protein, partial [Dokdonella sp.]|nr:winged helix-turn-helix domain-containing protein [Dokdonella sp.]